MSRKPVENVSFDAPQQFQTIRVRNIQVQQEEGYAEITIPAQPIPEQLIESLKAIGLRESQIEETVITVSDFAFYNFITSNRI